ncbi:MAG: type II secretion system F family protein [bacterium]|jgi:type II secretory pathway component PulF
MPETFSYSARTAEGEKRSGTIQAEAPERVAAILEEMRLIPIEIKPQKQEVRPALFGFLRSRQYEDLILFTRNLSTLYKAGIPLLRALDTIKIGPANGYFNRTIERIRLDVQSGRSLSDAMGEHPELFNKIYIASIAAGEASGKLDEILDSLGYMLERDLDLNRQIKSALRYPIIVICAIVLAFAVLITFVIPRFIDFYSSMGAQLPAPTRIIIWVHHIVTTYWAAVIALLIAAGLTLRKIYATTSGKLYFDTWFLSLPVFGDLIIKGNIARFSYMFHLLLKSGLPMVKSLELLSETVKNARLTEEIKVLSSSFKEGRELDGIKSRLQYFPEMGLQMIRIGLESGSIDSMLSEVALHYNKEVDYKSRHLASLLEPILTVVLGFFVLIVALAIFLPMWNLAQIFRG